MSTGRYTKIVLTAIAAALTAIACRPFLNPPPAMADMSSADFYIEPGVYNLRAPDGSRSQLGKVVIDLHTGKIWGFPTGTSAPYPIFAGAPEPPLSHPYLLGKFALEDMAKER